MHDAASAPDAPAPTARPPLEVVVVCTRDVGGRATGRVVVLRSHLAALERLGHRVRVVVIAPQAPADGPWTRRFPTTHVPSPGLLSTGASAVRAVLEPALRRVRRRPGPARPSTLNECLFVDGRVRRLVARAGAGADVVVLDGLRTATAADRLEGARVVVDLDDLLSDRYRRMLDRVRSSSRGSGAGSGAGAPVDVLGFAAERVPPALRGPAAALAASLLGFEARRAAAREGELARSAAAVSLVSTEEAGRLQQRTGRPVAWLPPAVDVPDEPVPAGEGLLFLGGLDYRPNADAVRVYRDEVLPALRSALGERTPELHLVGHCPPELRAELEVPGVVVEGFVPDLRAALSRRALVAPLQDPGGVKLKVLDALAAGLPVVGTPQAFDGTGLPADLRFGAPDGAGLARRAAEVVADDALRDRLAAGGRAHVARTFSPAAGAERWGRLLDGVTAGAGAAR
ncbi:glycosyltransferase [Quadrisphaera sp. INWT6]|uniref:glycosyltransferase n=1 Tax=Quadrisphaera sp. INWT6 TaxID=2596917 RepID=UPI0018923D76|nr:glycosyltransferase [Quadrisphaera sp. INWT6]